MLHTDVVGNLTILMLHFCSQWCSHWRKGAGRPQPPSPSPTLISKPKKFQQFQFQTSGILLFTVVQKLYEHEISEFLPCMSQGLDNLRQLLFFSNYVGKIDHFMLDLLKSFLLWIIRTKSTMKKSLNVIL